MDLETFLGGGEVGREDGLTLLGVILKGPGGGEMQLGPTWRSYLGEERGDSVLSRFC